MAGRLTKIHGSDGATGNLITAPGQGRPILSQARSRSKGPLSDQVADPPNSSGQCRSRVDCCRPRLGHLGSANGASCPFPWVLANVPSPNPQQPLAAGNGTRAPRTAFVDPGKPPEGKLDGGEGDVNGELLELGLHQSADGPDHWAFLSGDRGNCCFLYDVSHRDRRRAGGGRAH